MFTKKSIIITVTLLLAVVTSIAMIHTAYAKLVVTIQPQVVTPGGSVTLQGTADPGAVIVIRMTNPNGVTLLLDQITAGNDGSFTYTISFPSQPSDKYPVGTYNIVVRNDETGETQTLSVKFQYGGMVKGVVVDEKGNPVPDAEIVALGTGLKAKTGSDGSFVLFLSPGTYTLEITKPGYVSTEVKVTIEAGKETNIGKVTIQSYGHLISVLSKAVNSLSQAVTEIQGNISKLVSSLKQLQAKVNDNSEAISKANAKISNLSDSLAKISNELSSLTSTIDKLESQINQLNTSIATKLSSIKSKLNELESKKADITALSQLQNEIQTIKSQMVTKDELNKQLSSKAGIDKVNALSKQIQNLSTEISNLEKRVSTLEAATQSLGQLTNTLQSLKATVSSLQKTVSEFQNLQTKIESATNKASSASSTAMVGIILGIIGIIIAIVAVILVYRKIAV